MAKIGIYDSGIGGLTTLSSIKKLCGGEFFYFADKAHVPLGMRNTEDLIRIGIDGVGKLIALGAECVVIACNTMTLAAKEEIVKCYPNAKIVGAEPAILPAVAGTSGKLALIATPVTVRSHRLADLIKITNRKIDCFESPNLALIIENNWDNDICGYICSNFSFLHDYEGLILGCTHYVFVVGCFKSAFPNLRIFDGNDGIARRVLDLTGGVKSIKTTVKFLTDSSCDKRKLELVLNKYEKNIEINVSM